MTISKRLAFHLPILLFLFSRTSKSGIETNGSTPTIIVNAKINLNECLNCFQLELLREHEKEWIGWISRSVIHHRFDVALSCCVFYFQVKWRHLCVLGLHSFSLHRKCRFLFETKTLYFQVFLVCEIVASLGNLSSCFTTSEIIKAKSTHEID